MDTNGIDFGKFVVSSAEGKEKTDAGKIEIKLLDNYGNLITLENPELNDKPWEVTREELDKIKKIAEEIYIKRGQIISKSIFVEDHLELSIKTILFGTNITENLKLFEKFILRSTFFTFENKRIILSRMIKNYPILKDRNYSEHFRIIKEAIDIRNSFAHGKVIFREKVVFLEYVKEGKIERDELNDNCFMTKFQILMDASLKANEIYLDISKKVKDTQSL